MTKQLLVTAAVAILYSKGNAQITVYTSEAAWKTAMGATTTVDFDAFVGPINTQYAGLTFSPQQIANPRTEARPFFKSPSNVLLTNAGGDVGGGGFWVDMAAPTFGVGMWFYDLTLNGNGLFVRDATTNLLGSVSLPSGPSGQWTFIGVTSQGGPIRSAQVLYRSNDFVAVDNFQYGVVPEPMSLGGLAVGLAWMWTKSKRRSPSGEIGESPNR